MESAVQNIYIPLSCIHLRHPLSSQAAELRPSSKGLKGKKRKNDLASYKQKCQICKKRNAAMSFYSTPQTLLTKTCFPLT